jgi:F420-non-reducing hydrogenase iron-sulfur subunit
MLKDMGIEEERVRLEWISAAEGEKVKRVVNEMTEQLKKLGPLGIPQKHEEWDKEIIELARQADQTRPVCACQAVPAAKPEVAHV